MGHVRGAVPTAMMPDNSELPRVMTLFKKSSVGPSRRSKLFAKYTNSSDIPVPARRAHAPRPRSPVFFQFGGVRQRSCESVSCMVIPHTVSIYSTVYSMQALAPRRSPESIRKCAGP